MISGDRLGDGIKTAIDNYIATLTPVQKTFSDPQQRIDLMRVQGNVWIPQISTISTTPQNLSNLPHYSIFIVTVGTNNIIFNMENAAACQGCIAEFYIVDTNTGKVSLDGYSSQTVGGVPIFELWGMSGNTVKLISDGTNWLNLTPKTWKKVPDPGLLWLASKTSWSVTMDNFNSESLICDFSSDIALGSVGAEALFYMLAASGVWTAWRAYNDSNISNTPFAGNEYSHYLGYTDPSYAAYPVLFDLSADYKVQFTANNSSADIYISHAIKYLQ